LDFFKFLPLGNCRKLEGLKMKLKSNFRFRTTGHENTIWREWAHSEQSQLQAIRQLSVHNRSLEKTFKAFENQFFTYAETSDRLFHQGSHAKNYLPRVTKKPEKIKTVFSNLISYETAGWLTITHNFGRDACHSCRTR